MALNPPLTQNGDPCRVEGEFFIMKRDGIEFEMKVENGNKYTAKGFCLLTTSRVVCVNKDKSSLFKCFDLPISYISKETFEQPIFGSNYIGGVCNPLFNLLPGNIKFKIWFTQGGCGTFVPAFFDVISKVKKSKNNRIDDKYMNKFSEGFANNAYIDKSDPSVIYYEQPSIVINNLEVKNKEDVKVGVNSYDNLPSENDVIIKDNQNLKLNRNVEEETTDDNQSQIRSQYPNINNIQVNNPLYTQNLRQNENIVNNPNNQEKYFGFFGPSLNKNLNQVNQGQVNQGQVNQSQVNQSQVNQNQVNQNNNFSVFQNENNQNIQNNVNIVNQNNNFSVFNNENENENENNRNQEGRNNNFVYN